MNCCVQPHVFACVQISYFEVGFSLFGELILIVFVLVKLECRRAIIDHLMRANILMYCKVQ